MNRLLKKGWHKRRRVVVVCRFPKIEGPIGFLIEQRAKHWAELCHRFENTREPPHWFGGLMSVTYYTLTPLMKTAQKLHLSTSVCFKFFSVCAKDNNILK